MYFRLGLLRYKFLDLVGEYVSGELSLNSKYAELGLNSAGKSQVDWGHSQPMALLNSYRDKRNRYPNNLNPTVLCVCRLCMAGLLK